MRAAATLVAVALFASAARAESPELARARQLKAELRYREAKGVLEAALGRGGASPGDLAAMHRLAGEVSAGLGDAAGAENHFAAWLALEPGAALPPGSSPKLRAPFESARARLGGRAFAAHPRASGRVIEVSIDDPLELAAAARARTLEGGETTARGRPPYRLRIPGEGPARVIVEVLDEKGNRLAVLGSPTSPIDIAAAPAPVTGPPPAEGRALYARPSTWLVAGGVLAAAGGVFAILAENAQSDLDDISDRARSDPFSVDFAEAAAVKRRGDRYALAANLGFATAAAAGIAAAALWWLGPDDPAPGLAPGADGGLSAVIRGHF